MEAVGGDSVASAMQARGRAGGDNARMSNLLPADILSTFEALFAEAQAVGEPDPTAMTLATADAAGRPSARIVLLKGFDARGFRFFTNFESDKGTQLAAQPSVALCFHWKTLQRIHPVTVAGFAWLVLAWLANVLT